MSFPLSFVSQPTIRYNFSLLYLLNVGNLIFISTNLIFYLSYKITACNLKSQAVLIHIYIILLRCKYRQSIS